MTPISILMVLRTKNLSNDDRVKKEIRSLQNAGCRVDLFCAHDDSDKPQGFDNVRIKSVRLPWGAAPKGKGRQLLNLASFVLHWLCFFTLRKKKYALVWIHDPVLFPVVRFTRAFSTAKVIWDHHELPPQWFLSSKFFREFFRKAYIQTDLIVHANAERSRFLETAIQAQARDSLILKNYPSSNTLRLIDTLEEPLESWTKERRYVYLQNSLDFARCGIEVFSALKQLGLSAVHVGAANRIAIDKIKKTIGADYVERHIFFAGTRRAAEINLLLRRATITMVFYRNTSANQFYCEPNRLYQAVKNGVPVITGNNPTLKSFIVETSCGVWIDSDGSDIDRIVSGTRQLLENLRYYRDRANLLTDGFKWEDYDSIIKEKMIGG